MVNEDDADQGARMIGRAMAQAALQAQAESVAIRRRLEAEGYRDPASPLAFLYVQGNKQKPEEG